MKKGCRVMETTGMLFLLTTLTAAAALQRKHGPQTDIIRLEDAVPSAKARSPLTRSLTEDAPLLQSASDVLLRSILMPSKNAQARLRRRRAPSKGCQFGTCQMHNLASTLYRMGQTNNKEQSKGAGDPNGYGR